MYNTRTQQTAISKALCNLYMLNTPNNNETKNCMRIKCAHFHVDTENKEKQRKKTTTKKCLTKLQNYIEKEMNILNDGELEIYDVFLFWEFLLQSQISNSIFIKKFDFSLQICNLL